MSPLVLAGLVVFAGLGSFLGAQTVPLSGPVEAYTFDPPAASFRAIQGRLGASLLGPALLRGFEYGSVAPQRDYGLGFQRGRGSLVIGLGSAQPASTELAGTFATPEKVVWSEDGLLAVLYSSAGNWIQTVRGFPSASISNPPAANPALSLAPLGGSISAVATDARGQRTVIGITAGTVVGATPGGGPGGVYELTGGGNFVPLLATPNPQSLAFSADGRTLYVLDGASRQLTVLNLTDMTSQPWPLAELADPFAIRMGSGTAQQPVLYVAGRGDRLLVAYDVASRQAIASLPLDATPDRIEPLGLNSFLLRSRVSAEDPLWSFTSAPHLAVYFVPGAPLNTQPSNAQPFLNAQEDRRR